MTARVRSSGATVATLGVAAWLGGCAAEPSARPAPGTASVRVTVQAEPKAGYDPTAASGYGTRGGYANPGGATSFGGYGFGASDPETYGAPDAFFRGGGGAFTRIDYGNLEDVIVYLEPRDGATGAMSQPPSPPRAPPHVHVYPDPKKWAGQSVVPATVGQPIALHNAADRPVTISVRTEAGGFEDLGDVPAGGEVEYVPSDPGPVEVLAGAGDAPAGTAYAAPSAWVKRARGGQRVTFTGVPPGAYRATAWHPRLPGSSQDVELSAGEVADARVVVGVNVLPKVP